MSGAYIINNNSFHATLLLLSSHYLVHYMALRDYSYLTACTCMWLYLKNYIRSI